MSTETQVLVTPYREFKEVTVQCQLRHKFLVTQKKLEVRRMLLTQIIGNGFG